MDESPIFRDLPEDVRAALYRTAQHHTCAVGTVLCYPGDSADRLYLLTDGKCKADGGAEILPGALIDPVAVLGGLPHRVKVTVVEDCALLSWSAAALLTSEAFAGAALRHLADALQTARARLDMLAAPINYRGAHSAVLLPGPYFFEDVTMLFAFCDADLDATRALLPPGLKLLRTPILRRGVVLIALTDFPHAFPIDRPAARMAPYTETTCFVPVRFGKAVGLYVAHIYPSAWEPILLGREIYGFPKRLGQTVLGPRRAALAVDDREHLSLAWEQTTPSREARFVGALLGLLGLYKHAGTLTFQAGEVLRKAMRLPGYRRVDAYNRKRILASGATLENPTYAIDCLTRATFGVLRWYQIAEMRRPVLKVSGGPLMDLDLSLRAGYRTQLDMRLGAGRVLRDYLTP